MSFLKLIEAGVPKENLGLLAVPLTPLQIVLPLIISKYTNGPRPLTFFLNAIPLRIFSGLLSALLVYYTPYFKDQNGDFSMFFYSLCLIASLMHSVFTYFMFVSQMSFYAQVSDKSIGGTYMTFLNTVTNLGGNWPTTAALYVASFITIKKCVYSIASKLSQNITESDFSKKIIDNTCSSNLEAQVILILKLKLIIFDNFNNF
jgi:MFS transporter, PAT family, solute carrier family 33 (acetyl-CoA transportor), member 1